MDSVGQRRGQRRYQSRQRVHLPFLHTHTMIPSRRRLYHIFNISGSGRQRLCIYVSGGFIFGHLSTMDLSTSPLAWLGLVWLLTQLAASGSRSGMNISRIPHPGPFCGISLRLLTPTASKWGIYLTRVAHGYIDYADGIRRRRKRVHQPPTAPWPDQPFLTFLSLMDRPAHTHTCRQTGAVSPAPRDETVERRVLQA